MPELLTEDQALGHIDALEAGNLEYDRSNEMLDQFI